MIQVRWKMYSIPSTRRKHCPCCLCLVILLLAGSDESGNLRSQIKPGSTGEKIFYANWLSDRNKAWKAKDIGKPYIYEDDDMILFTYEIGKVEQNASCL